MPIGDSFEFADSEKVDVVATLTWTKPYPHEVVFTGNADEDDDAYLYAIVAYTEGDWWTFYFGMVFDQTISDRHKAQDHKSKLIELKERFPNTNFHLCLATLSLQSRIKVTKKLVSSIEGLLIFSNIHEDLENKRKVSRFSSDRSFYIANVGFIDHLEASEIGYGVFHRDD